MSDAPGPGDPETWPASTGHPNDPRTEDTYGPCHICGEETTHYAVFLDYDGLYAVFTCEEHLP
jgi:hypothetical protein